MNQPRFDTTILTDEDLTTALSYLGSYHMTRPNVVLDPDGSGPYLYRWHLHYDNGHGNVFFHVQAKSDPERPLHDHPWDNTSIILSGGYDELWQPYPATAHKEWREAMIATPMTNKLRAGQTWHRPAGWAHRLILPPDIPYTMTLFATGPKVKEWGFWYPDGWHHNKRHVDDRGPAGSLVSIGHHEEKAR